MLLLNDYLKKRFGCKVYNLALNGGFTCPNRDGKLGTKGCIFCSEGGSGEFAGNVGKSIAEQIEEGKQRLTAKIKDGKCKYISKTFTFGSLCCGGRRLPFCRKLPKGFILLTLHMRRPGKCA